MSSLLITTRQPTRPKPTTVINRIFPTVGLKDWRSHQHHDPVHRQPTFPLQNTRTRQFVETQFGTWLAPIGHDMILARPMGDALGLGSLVYPPSGELIPTSNVMKQLLPRSAVIDPKKGIKPARPAFLRE
jgi:hypothetical protein